MGGASDALITSVPSPDTGFILFPGKRRHRFDDKKLCALLEKLSPLGISDSPFVPSRELEKQAIWFNQGLVVEVAFTD